MDHNPLSKVRIHEAILIQITAWINNERGEESSPLHRSANPPENKKQSYKLPTDDNAGVKARRETKATPQSLVGHKAKSSDLRVEEASARHLNPGTIPAASFLLETQALKATRRERRAKPDKGQSTN